MVAHIFENARYSLSGRQPFPEQRFEAIEHLGRDFL